MVKRDFSKMGGAYQAGSYRAVSKAPRSRGFVKTAARAAVANEYKGRLAQRGNERKFFDTAISFSFDATGEVPATGQLTLIPQGVTESTRVGRKCVIKSIHIRGTFTFTPGATTSGVDDVYLFVVLDKQCNGAAAAVTDVLTSNAMGQALTNLENSDRFVILKRFQQRLVSNAGVSTAFSRDQVPFEWYKKVNIPIEYDSSASTGALTTIRSNNIFLLAGSGLIGDDVSTCDATCRLRFDDN